VLKIIAVSLLVPPVSLLIVTLLGLLALKRYWRAGYIVAWLGGLSLLALSLPVVAGSLLVALEQDLPLTPDPARPPQAIVILGGDVQRTKGGAMYPGPLSFVRIRSGALLARQTDLPVLITGGKLRPSDTPIGPLMADSLRQDFGVPVRWVEAESLDTWENAHLSAPILRRNGIRSIYLVTDAWHMRRALLAFATTGIVVTAAPTHLDRAPPDHVLDFVPSVVAWQTSYFAFHEWIGCAWYALRRWWSDRVA
jgi:uncharacterized SAM-binding protein YcdF (DUF218 family)